MGRLFLISMLLILTACNGSESGTGETKLDGDSANRPVMDSPDDTTPDLVDDTTPIVDDEDGTDSDVSEDDTDNEDPTSPDVEVDPMPEYSILENYNFLNNVMPLEFQNDQFNTTRIRTYWIYTDGRAVENKIAWDGNYILKCYDEVTIDGDETSGVIRVTNSRYLWRFNSSYNCNSNGDYPYSVDENGLHIEVDGQVLTFTK